MAINGMMRLLLGLAAFAFLTSAALACPALARASQLNGSDWQHDLELTMDLRRHQPTVPIVFLIGDSLARESTVDDASWSEETSTYGVGRVLTYNLGSRSQSFIQSKDLVNLMPRGRIIVLICVNPGRFMAGPAPSVLKLDRRVAAKHIQHHYSSEHTMSRSGRLAMLREWAARSKRLFGKRYMANLARLDGIIRTCRRRGFRPVLVDMPMDYSVVGTTMDRVSTTYRYGCMSLATQYGIPWVDFTHKADLVSEDFYDIAHMVRTGWEKWQHVLAKKSAELLRRYGMAE